MYDHQNLEKKWQGYWEEHEVFKTNNTSYRPGYYVLDMFPYPSGAGLHVGHPEGYTANDIVARYKHASGYNVLHPMGWDAFGLPAENYAIKTGTHPRITTDQNIATFKRQIRELGFSYDWDREIDTTDPKYFKWTQWIFLKLFENGLAYEQDLPINYCPSCKTGLANEEVLSDFSCERCGTKVEKKKIRQWVLAITQYADRLLEDVNKLDWPEGIKDMQRNWIGKSEGCEFEMKKSDDSSKTIRVYTTRIDTVFGMTYAVIAPDHPSVEDFIDESQRQECEKYIEKAASISDQDRMAEDKEKTGVFTGSYVVNPYNQEKVPLWIADYVLGNYGTGAVMAVPAHDTRDFEFAKKFGIEIRQVTAEKYDYSGENGPRDDAETLDRKTVDIILENDKGEILLQIENHANGVHTHFVGGGIEEGQTELEAVKDEILEETGYTDIEIVGPVNLSYTHSFGFRANKNKNQRCLGRVFYVKLLSDNQVKSEIDDGKHTVEWVKKEEVVKRINWIGHGKFWDWFINGEKPYTGTGTLVNSGEYNGLTSQEAQKVLIEKAEKEGFGHKKVNYKLRDWLFSRQRYWGEPIPLIHLDIDDYNKLPKEQNSEAWIKDDTTLMIGDKEYSKIYDGLYGKIVCDYNLPLELPEVEKYEPAGDGTSPLTQVDSFVNVKLAKNLSGKRETNTMPQWGGSCWYYLRFMDPQNDEELVNKEAEKYWGQVDSYVGGAEHAVLHLLYARFWHKFLYDIGVVSHDEPFYRLRNQGMILGLSYRNSKGKLIANDEVEERDGKYYEKASQEELERIPAKMSKSLKNVINPDDIVQEYGADTLRLYEMYMADFKDAAPWNPDSIIGVRRFLDKVYRLFIEDTRKFASSDEEAMKTLHKAIKKVGEDIENYKFNTAIAELIKCINAGEPKDETLNRDWKESFIRLLHPFAPHMAEECYEKLFRDTKPYLKAYFATGNEGKVTRAQSVLDTLRSKMTLEQIPELVELEETGKTPLECAMQKIEVYKDKGYSVPILAADTAVYFEDQDFDPTHVRRAAIEKLGKDESQMTKKEIAEVMIKFYIDLAKKQGGSVDFYYIDAFVVLYPDGQIESRELKREYTLTDTFTGDIFENAPMRSLYISKITGKRASETTMQDYIKEFAGQGEIFAELFNLKTPSVFNTSWPKYDEKYLQDDSVTIGVQVLGKLRGQITIAKDASKDEVLSLAKENSDVAKWLEGKDIIKEIYVPGKIVNFVVK